MKKCFIISIIFIASCGIKRTDCNFTAAELLTSYPDKLFVPDNFQMNAYEINDKGIDSIVGGVYFFYPNGHLKKYAFFKTMSAYSYSENYDENGELLKVEGKPLVSSVVKEIGSDSAFFKMYFFTLHKTYQDIEISVSNGSKFVLKLKDDKLYSNMKVTSFGLNTKGMYKFDVHFLIRYKNECNGNSLLLTDTLEFIKNPNLKFVSHSSENKAMRTGIRRMRNQA